MSTQTNTYITPGDGKTYLYYSAEKWTNVRLSLESAGQVDVGTMASLAPVGSGKGITLATTGEPIEFSLDPGDRLYLASNSTNRVQVVLYQPPYLETITAQGKEANTIVRDFYSSLKGMFGAVLRRSGKSDEPEKKDDSFCPPRLKIPYFK